MAYIKWSQVIGKFGMEAQIGFDLINNFSLSRHYFFALKIGSAFYVLLLQFQVHFRLDFIMKVNTMNP